MADVVQLRQRGSRSAFRAFLEQVVAKHDNHLLNCGPPEQVETGLQRMDRLNRIAPLTPVTGTLIDLAGFGTAPLLYRTTDAEPFEYLLLSDIAEALGWFMPRAHDFVEKMAAFDLEDQRREDEERGDERLGWRQMRNYIGLGIELVIDDPTSKPDAGGRRMSDFSDWLVSRERIPALLTASPWSKEFMDNTMPALGYAMREAWGDKLREILSYRTDGTPPGNAFDDLFPANGLSREEAEERARRGPAIDEGPGAS